MNWKEQGQKISRVGAGAGKALQCNILMFRHKWFYELNKYLYTRDLTEEKADLPSKIR